LFLNQHARAGVFVVAVQLLDLGMGKALKVRVFLCKGFVRGPRFLRTCGNIRVGHRQAKTAKDSNQSDFQHDFHLAPPAWSWVRFDNKKAMTVPEIGANS
jgi:hypothetical protein